MRQLLLLFFLLSCSPLSAEELYVRNQVFPGVVVGSGSEMYVEAAPLARALDARLVEVKGGYLLSLSEEPAGQELCGPGKVVVEGMVIPSRTGPAGEVLVHLQRTAQALGGKVVANKDLGTVDLYLAQTGSAASGDFTSGGVQGVSGWYRDVTGAEIPDLPVSGKLFGSDFSLLRVEAKGRTLVFTGRSASQNLSIIMLSERSLATSDLKVKPDERMVGVHIRAEWTDETGATHRDSWMNGYSLHLMLSQPVNGVAQGRLYISLPDAGKSYLSGTFNVTL